MSEVEKAMRGSSAYYAEEERVALLNAALMEAHDKALEDAERAVPISLPVWDYEMVCEAIRALKSKKAVTP